MSVVTTTLTSDFILAQKKNSLLLIRVLYSNGIFQLNLYVNELIHK